MTNLGTKEEISFPYSLIIVFFINSPIFLVFSISFFKLESDDYRVYGERLARLNLPTLFVMEGGYAIEQVGVNTVNVLEGFENG